MIKLISFDLNMEFKQSFESSEVLWLAYYLELSDDKLRLEFDLAHKHDDRGYGLGLIMFKLVLRKNFD